MSQEAQLPPVAEGRVPEPDADSADPHREIVRLREQNADLQERLHAHPAISLAQGVLMERYRLPAPEASFALLREASQRFNIKLHTLADAVVRTPHRPDGPARAEDRARTAPPPLPGLRTAGADRTHQGEVLSAALHRVLDITGAGMGNVQLAEGGRLRMVRHSGLEREFTSFFAFVDSPTTSCAQAAEDRRQVTVRDVATADVFDEGSRRVILRAGSRACHSVPLVNRAGVPIGMASSHHERPLAGFTRAQLHALETTGLMVGRWLSWHRHTVVRDALDHLHATAIAER
ncbi:GAF and ANTAR domain-containing protein [Streptomyces sp. NBC_00638]|uniref:GAF and ANTAR domain-containing protein n=1 Tax=unclassified Streptomyces TaxID=2593676 RepID=UPI002253DA49|nr:GAF and ANTAR domain-containing protein [Streptomyces sp. NBC_00638]MCX5001495.1 GAF and ANTAR domain-containing protein [Streptomyces sp. NBC_00638]